MVNLNWSSVTLTVTKDILEIDSSYTGKMIFTQADIISLEAHKAWLNIGMGRIVIKHNLSKYDPKVIFWTYSDPQEIINAIIQIGFLNNNDGIPAIT